ncbi:hypothetical protein X375_05850 [Oenococcus oeni S13]|uniref:O-antigen ligase family protein n=1 Tax=Oenococcus oeni TaxID=1247 RepID=UPI00050E7570|nr:O-antigen ligase family protein [Oenococcus oeni]KGH62270.1 hypothetical protein X375_05850 [Oenococcus oeni S13]
MEISKRKVNLWIVAIFLLADSRFFYLIPMTSYLGGAASNKTLVGVIGFVLFVSMTIINGGIVKLGIYGKSIFLFLTFLFFQGIYEYFTYGYSFTTILFSIIPYFTLLMYMEILYVAQEDFEGLLKLIENIAIILSVLLLIQMFVYNHIHTMFLHFTLSDWFTVYYPTAKGRFYTVAEGLIRCVPLLAFYDLLRPKKTMLRSYLSFSFSLLAIIFIDQSRMYFLSVVIALIVMYMVANKDKITLNRLIGAIIILIVATIFIMQKLNSIYFDLSDSTNGSGYAREDAINYYWNLLSTHFFTGLGIVIPDPGAMYYNLIKGPEGIYNFDDIGLMGIYASMGFIGVIWYIYIVIKNFIYAHKTKGVFERALSYGLSFMMVFCCLTLSYLDKERLMALVITMVLINYGYRKSKIEIRK